MTAFPTDADEWRVLTVRQPWAWAIQPGGKTVENRAPSATRWATHIGRHIIIRAGKTFDERGQHHPGVRTLAGGTLRPDVTEHLPAFRPSTIYTVGCLVDVHSAVDDRCDCDPTWAELAYPGPDGGLVQPATHLVLGDLVLLPDPITDTENGRLGLTRPTPLLLEAVLSQLDR